MGSGGAGFFMRSVKLDRLLVLVLPLFINGLRMLCLEDILRRGGGKDTSSSESMGLGLVEDPELLLLLLTRTGRDGAATTDERAEVSVGRFGGVGCCCWWEEETDDGGCFNFPAAFLF